MTELDPSPQETCARSFGYSDCDDVSWNYYVAVDVSGDFSLNVYYDGSLCSRRFANIVFEEEGITRTGRYVECPSIAPRRRATYGLIKICSPFVMDDSGQGYHLCRFDNADTSGRRGLSSVLRSNR